MDPWVVVPMLIVVAVVFVDAMQAAAAETFRGGRLTIAECSRWPKRRGCEQACLHTTPWVMRDAPRAT